MWSEAVIAYAHSALPSGKHFDFASYVSWFVMLATAGATLNMHAVCRPMPQADLPPCFPLHMALFSPHPYDTVDAPNSRFSCVCVRLDSPN